MIRAYFIHITFYTINNSEYFIKSFTSGNSLISIITLRLNHNGDWTSRGFSSQLNRYNWLELFGTMTHYHLLKIWKEPGISIKGEHAAIHQDNIKHYKKKQNWFIFIKRKNLRTNERCKYKLWAHINTINQQQ
jgi:hypothetical protein